LVSVADYGDAILESIFAFAFYQSDLFAAGYVYNDYVIEADNARPRNFIRHMCAPPPFESRKISTSANTTTSDRGPAEWNPKAPSRRYRVDAVPSKPTPRDQRQRPLSRLAPGIR
jgi:hypothetical protein